MAQKSENKELNQDFGSLLEKIHAEIKTITESQNILQDKLDSTLAIIAKNTDDSTWLKILGTDTNREAAKINGKLVKMEDDIRIIKGDLGKLTHLETAK